MTVKKTTTKAKPSKQHKAALIDQLCKALSTQVHPVEIIPPLDDEPTEQWLNIYMLGSPAGYRYKIEMTFVHDQVKEIRLFKEKMQVEVIHTQVLS